MELEFRFNGGRGALLCSNCRWIVKEDIRVEDVEDKPHYCKDCQEYINMEKNTTSA